MRYSTGNGLITLLTRLELSSSSRHSVSFHLLSDLPADVVPLTYKKTKMTKDDEPKTKKGADEESDDEKPKATADGKNE